MTSVTIRLPDEKARQLRELAAARGASESALVERALDALFRPPAGTSLSEVLRDYIGAGGDGPATDSAKMDDVLTEMIAAKRDLSHARR